MVWHITWSVNSIGHVWGCRNYETRDDSRNSFFFVGLLSNGDGWHNNHHADQRAAAHDHKWWEVDVSYTTLQVMKIFGLASDLVPIGNRLKAVGVDDGVSAQSSSVVPASHLSTKKNESQKNESEAAV